VKFLRQQPRRKIATLVPNSIPVDPVLEMEGCPKTSQKSSKEHEYFCFSSGQGESRVRDAKM
jgi:hypothetical protein